MKFTEKEVVAFVDSERVIETFDEETVKGQTSAKGVVEVDGKFYQIEFSQSTDEWADVLAWDQEAPEIEKKTVLTEKWVTKY